MPVIGGGGTVAVGGADAVGGGAVAVAVAVVAVMDGFGGGAWAPPWLWAGGGAIVVAAVELVAIGSAPFEPESSTRPPLDGGIVMDMAGIAPSSWSS